MPHSLASVLGAVLIGMLPVSALLALTAVLARLVHS